MFTLLDTSNANPKSSLFYNIHSVCPETAKFGRGQGLRKSLPQAAWVEENGRLKRHILQPKPTV
jgi:hypothetical protein